MIPPIGLQIEQVSQLSALVQAQLEYHKQAVQILQQVTVRLEERYLTVPEFYLPIFFPERMGKEIE